MPTFSAVKLLRVIAILGTIALIALLAIWEIVTGLLSLRLPAENVFGATFATRPQITKCLLPSRILQDQDLILCGPSGISRSGANATPASAPRPIGRRAGFWSISPTAASIFICSERSTSTTHSLRAGGTTSLDRAIPTISKPELK